MEIENLREIQMRNPSIELLRIICCFMIIVIHSMPAPSTFLSVGSNYGAVASSIVHSLVRPGLPVFFMISGYFILNSKALSLKKVYIKRMLSLLIPFFVYGILHVFISDWAVTLRGLKFFLSKITSGTTSLDIHFWFVYTMLGLYIIAPLLRKAIINLTESEALIGLVAMVLISMYNLYFREITKISPNVHYLIPIPDIGLSALFFISGGLIARTISKFTMQLSMYILGIGFLISVIAYHLTANKYNFNMYADSGIGVFLSSIGMLLIFSKLSLYSSYTKTINFIAKHTYGAFLIHLSILRHIRNVMPINVFDFPVVYSISISLITLATSIAVAIVVDYTIVNKIMNRIPFING